MFKKLIIIAVLAAASAANAGPAMMAPRLAIALPPACAYKDIKAAVLMRQVAPSIPALMKRGCSSDDAQEHLSLMYDQGFIESTGSGWASVWRIK